WKLSIIEWLFGLVFLGSQYIGKKTIVERMLSGSLTLPPNIWKRLNLMWSIFFIGVGFINLYVMFNYDTDDWVTFKTFGVPGLMVIFIILQMALIYKHIPETKE
ncbi:MAG: inner membrane-spanning protein YciB, partial [Gammaproteobacteria bacterium]